MNDELSIFIRALLSDTAEADINGQLQKLQKKLKSIKLGLKIDTSAISAIEKFNESIQKVDNILKQNVQSTSKVSTEFNKQKMTIKDLEKEYGELGKEIKEVIRLNSQLEESGRSSTYKTNAGTKIDVNTDANGFVNSARITEANAALGTLIGTYKGLQGEEANEARLLQTLNQLYGDREVRAHSLNTATGKWTAVIAENAKQNRVLTGVLDQSTGSLYKQDDALKQVVNRNVGWGEQLKIAISRVPIWMAAMTIFYQSLRFFSNGVKYVSELDKALNEIGIVSGKSSQELEQLGFSYQKIAYEMASTTKQIAEASVTFYRQGLSQAEVMERVRVTTMAAKISGLEFAQTAELITAATNTMGISAENAADVFAYLGDATATEFSEIAQSFQKVGASAVALQIPFEKVASWIATISSKTRLGSEEIGNSLKTMIARMAQLTETGWNEEDATKINDVAKSLKSVLNIDLVDSATGQFRNFADVLDEIGASWATLDVNSKAYLANTVGGVRQQAKFFALMDGYTESINLYNGALNATGVATQKYNKYLESTEAYLNKLTTAGTGIWQKTFNSEDIRTGIFALTELVNAFGWLIDKLGFFPVVAGAATIGLSLFNKTVKNMGLLTSTSIASALGLSGAFAGIAATSPAAAVGVGIFNAALNVGVIMLITAAIQGLIGLFSKLRAESDKQAQIDKQSLDNYKSKKDTIESLISKYNELNGATGEDLEKQKELQNIQNQLGRLLPGVIDYVDESGNAHLRSAEKIQEEINKLKTLQTEYDKAIEKRRQNEIKQIQAELDHPALLRSQQASNSDVDSGYWERQIASYEDPVRVAELRARLQELLNPNFSYNKNTDPNSITPESNSSGSSGGSDFSKSFDLSLPILEQINSEVEALKSTLSLITDEEEKRNFIAEKLVPAYQKQLTVLNQYADFQSGLVDNAKSDLKKLVSDSDYQKILSGDYSTLTIKSESVADAIDNVRDLTSAFNDTKSSIREINNELTQTGIDISTSYADDLKEWQDNAEDVADKIIDAYKDYYKRQQDMQDDAIQSQIDAEESRHDAVSDNLDKELDAYEEIISTKLKLIDQAADEEDYAKKLNTAQKERADIQRQIDVLSLDDSLASRAKVSELRKQLTEKDTDITDMQADREKDLRKESLQDQLDDYKEKINKQKTLENDYYEAEKKRLQDSREYFKGYYDNLINDEERWSSYRKAILEEDSAIVNKITSELTSMYGDVANGFINNMERMGSSVQNNLITQLNAALELYSKLGNKPIIPDTGGSGGGSGNGSTGSGGSDSTSSDWSKEIWGQDYEVKNSGTLIYKNGVYVPVENFKYLPSEVLEEARRQKASVASYDTGGMTPSWGSEPKLAFVHENEKIMNQSETSDWLKGLQIMKSMLPQLPDRTVTNNNGAPTVYIEATIYGTDKKAANNFIKDINTKFQRLGFQPGR